MNLPEPKAGLVISYSYLWHNEQMRGEADGRKDRPCAVLLTVSRGERTAVVALAITHRNHANAADAVEVPPAVKQHLGLDGERSWVIVSEANVFAWPGPDLRPRNREDLSTVSYGFLPAKMLVHIRRRYEDHAMRGTIKIVQRSPL